jgi:hypothetical protein
MQYEERKKACALGNYLKKEKKPAPLGIIIRAHKKSQISFGLIWLRRRVMRTLFLFKIDSLTNIRPSRHIAKYLERLQTSLTYRVLTINTSVFLKKIKYYMFCARLEQKPVITTYFDRNGPFTLPG